jgi:hypothetical protein
MITSLVGVICLAIGLGAGYLIAKKKKVMRELREKRDGLIAEIRARKDATKDDVINIIREKL